MALIRVQDHSKTEIYRFLEHWIPKIINPILLQKTRDIVIKVNLCKPLPPETGATTDVKIVDGLITYVNNSFPRKSIFVVESDARHTAETCFRRTGYYKLSKEYKNVQLVNLTKTGRTTKKDKRLKHFKNGLEISNLFNSNPLFISIAKLKTHEWELYTGILKNQFGCILTKHKGQYHPYLSDVITDINMIIRPDLCIIDGLIAMEGKGPTSGRPKRMDLLIIGNDPVATDIIGATIMGINYRRVPHLSLAIKRRLGEAKLKNIQVLGEKIENVEEKFQNIPSISFCLFRMSFKIRKLFLPISVSLPVEKLLRRLARSFYRHSFTEILTKKVIPMITEKIRSSLK